MKGFKKDRGGLVKKVKEFVMPSFKLTNNQVEEIPTVSTPRSDLYQQLSLMMDKKLHTAQTAVGDMFQIHHILVWLHRHPHLDNFMVCHLTCL